ncbi:fasciclin domain-containing protein [Deinococcus hopiensis]|uniref:Uncaracterized surface protein containing fasciclin (FAS1) repeats n=1 Tax=Deinococcus hopiensis KR-140 TaxID=695939 RepID=A0A1W1UB55_9DEIO|nr:fasciclin domain-containing protein [Deinococcus hopiensis]SMB78338.1 Uncaracterized surface protein containing fasciclin (FAS1) repeats [Deinococcus hopiensis KR-140]
MRKALLSVTLLLSGGAIAGGGSTVPSGNTIAAIVSNDPNFSTLLSAVQAAGLVGTLSSAGPYTVFAPTNAAFAKVPAGQLQALLNNREQLRALLLYHVVPGRVAAAQVKGLSSATTAQGGTLNVSTMGGKVMINDATVTRADIRASNGVIHVIDTVLMP